MPLTERYHVVWQTLSSRADLLAEMERVGSEVAAQDDAVAPASAGPMWSARS